MNARVTNQLNKEFKAKFEEKKESLLRERPHMVQYSALSVIEKWERQKLECRQIQQRILNGLKSKSGQQYQCRHLKTGGKRADPNCKICMREGRPVCEMPFCSGRHPTEICPLYHYNRCADCHCLGHRGGECRHWTPAEWLTRLVITELFLNKARTGRLRYIAPNLGAVRPLYKYPHLRPGRELANLLGPEREETLLRIVDFQVTSYPTVLRDFLLQRGLIQR